jgi:hypothetical protein
MKHIAGEIIRTAEVMSKDHNDVKVLVSRAMNWVEEFRGAHPAIAGTGEVAIGVTAIYFGTQLLSTVDLAGGKIPELLGAIVGGAGGGVLGGGVASTVGGIGITMMGGAFAIPAAAVTTIGATVGVLPGAVAGWFGGAAADSAMLLAETIFAGVSGASLIAFGLFMLILGFKDLWRAGGEFIAYLKSLSVSEINQGAQS